MVMIVAIAFGVSWTPYFLVTIATQFPGANYMQNHNYFSTMLLINLCAFINSCVNPFIYVAMSTRFRNGFRRIVRNALCCCLFSGHVEEDPFCGAENLHIKPSNNNNHKTNSASSAAAKPSNNSSVPGPASSATSSKKPSRGRSALCCPVYACRQILSESVTSGCAYVTNAPAPPAFASAAAAGQRMPLSHQQSSNSSNSRYPVYVTTCRRNNVRLLGGLLSNENVCVLNGAAGEGKLRAEMLGCAELLPRVSSMPMINDRLWTAEGGNSLRNGDVVELPGLQAASSYPDNSKESAI